MFAGDFGRISGTISDRETGDPLIGADIIIEGTQYGTASDDDGNYTIPYVPAGTYEVAASYMGYAPSMLTNVIVHADQITMLQFRLASAIIEVSGVTAVAERPLITVSETSTSRSITSQEMARLPASTTGGILALQPGVAQSYRGTHIRGGRTDEITYYVDGIVAVQPYPGYKFHYGDKAVMVNNNAVEEITMVSGGFDAEYGNALSGIVNIVTKEGGNEHTGALHYTTDEIFFGNDRLNYGYNRYNFSLGGPTPWTPRIRYFVSGELMQTDAYQEALYRVSSPRMDYQAQMKLSYHLPNAKGKVVVTGFKERRQWIPWALWNDYPNEAKYFDNMPVDRTKNWVASAKFNYMMTPKTLASLNVAVTRQQRAYGTRDYAWEDSVGRIWFDDYRIKGEHLFDYLYDGTLPPRDVLVDSLRKYNGIPENSSNEALRRNPYGIDGWFYTYGDFPTWSCQRNDDYQARFDLTHSISKIHELKAGLDFLQHRFQFPYSYMMQTALFWDSYDKEPYKIASYIQDKVDVSGLIARVGVRFDYFDPRTYTFAEPTDWDNDSIVHADRHYTISPRLGFSLPVTTRMKFRFNYGHYYQFPRLDTYYAWTDTLSPTRLRVLVGWTIGNIMLKPQKTVSYEIGFENLLTDDVALGFTVYYKDIYDLLHVREVPALPHSYYTYLNEDYGNVKGFEASLMKRLSNMWGVGINYTLQFAKGTAADDNEWVYPIPVIDYWLDFDERHSLHANLDLEVPGTFFIPPARHLLSSFVISYHSGLPYTPTDLRGNQLGDDNSARMPGYWNIDLKFRRSIPIGPAGLILSGAIYNLFNSEQVLFVYSTTGEPDDHGDPEPNLDQFGNIPITSSSYSPQVDHNHDGLATPAEYKQEWIAMLNDFYENPAYYHPGFKAQLGVGIEF